MTELLAAARSADTEFLVRRASTKGYEWASLITPPAYVAYVLARKGRAQLSVNRVLRATWVGGAAGVAGGAATGYATCAWSTEVDIRKRRIRAAYDTDSIRVDDHSTIGGLLGAVLTPAILWKRARLAHLILGGAGFGSAVGLLTHYGRSLTGDHPPPTNLPEIPIPAA
ncbi:hypothetical protein PUNSTDRAFT_120975 [Punctularia strigosozonata HHB-11173 SS5]|uniref:uncharacterized protein n=1 Tax=Punctularia strigosozonata (strain HHB-11173) TaxID=741275 RepID=UPI00044182C0|nr:uncharacterized protein PUNSTDRAFT_120975 [Punctularia strigosozonata HHB-11173 SS5]EIN07678.1 hypothetical protein PUNSTDRAFT_120975 [Punctularia strigosozonata HHB-11173 SS5]